MKLETDNKKDKELLEVKLTLPWQEFEPLINEAARNLGRDLEVPGFRKGQAPLEAIQQKFSQDKIHQEAAMLVLKRNWKEIVQKVNQETVGRPKINVLKLTPQNELVLAVNFIARPEVKLANYRKIAKNLNEQRKFDFQVSQEEIKSAINWLLRSRAKYVAITREAKIGDFVEINFNSFVDGQTLEGGKSQRHPMVLGEGKFMKGFEEELIGLKSGEQKNFSLVAPVDYYRQDLAGKAINFEVTVQSVQEILLPEFNDEFAKNIGKFKNIQEFEENIINGLKEEKIIKERKDFEAKLIKAITEESEMAVPEPLIEEELDALVNDLRENVKKANINFEDYLKQIKKTPPELRESFRERAQRNLKIAFLFQAIAEKENLNISSEEVNETMNTYLKRFDSTKKAKQEVDLETLRTYTENTLLNQKVLNFLENTAISQ